MLKIYKTSADTKETTIIEEIIEDSWIDLTSPTEKEIDNVVEKTKVDKDLILKMMDEDELPRVEQSGNGVLIVIDTPCIEDNLYMTNPLGIIITDSNYVITIAPKKIPVLNEFRKNEIKDFRTAKKIRFLIQILLKTASMYLKILRQIDKEIEEKEKKLKINTTNQDLIELLSTEKTLVYFMTSLKANDLVLEKLNKEKIFKLYENDLDLLEDAIIENKQAIEMSGIYKDILSSISNTYATVVSNNLNIAMKFLAGFTIVISVPTMISSFLGMNIPLGNLSNNPYSMIIVTVASLILSFIVGLILKKKNML